jgi:hypothetical protein
MKLLEFTMLKKRDGKYVQIQDLIKTFDDMVEKAKKGDKSSLINLKVLLWPKQFNQLGINYF